jgi:hypothetical protein
MMGLLKGGKFVFDHARKGGKGIRNRRHFPRKLL